MRKEGEGTNQGTRIEDTWALTVGWELTVRGKAGETNEEKVGTNVTVQQ